MKKNLSLKKETLARLGDDELADIVAGTFTFTCTFTNGQSCGGVCSGVCPSYTCPDIATLPPITVV